MDDESYAIQKSNIEKGIILILKGLNEEFDLDLTDENFNGTPSRIARAYREIFGGLKNTQQQVTEIFKSKFPSENYDSMIISKDIPAYSMCPHHLLPVEYKINFAYIPSTQGFVLGLSKLSRIIQLLAKRPVLQEKLTIDIVNAFEEVHPRGAGVLVEGSHFCMKMRGVNQTNANISTSSLTGCFKQPEVRSEFYRLIGK